MLSQHGVTPRKHGNAGKNKKNMLLRIMMSSRLIISFEIMQKKEVFHNLQQLVA
jgi:hypothetical protein